MSFNLARPLSFLVLSLFLNSNPAWAFIENTVKGYPNCMACHVSPRGGGLLNDYGRSVSNEMMSTWQIDGFEPPLGGLVENSERVTYGGHLRTIQTRSEDERRTLGRFF